MDLRERLYFGLLELYMSAIVIAQAELACSIVFNQGVRENPSSKVKVDVG
jgi:hypothetical protein